MHAQTGRKEATISFSKACDILKEAMVGYKIIHRYSHRIEWSFKFEKRARQYCPVDLLYMHLFQMEKAAEFHKEYNALSKLMSTSDIIVLAQLSNGVFRKFQGTYREHYEQRRNEFEQRTGIVVT